MSGLSGCLSVARAALGAVDPDGAMLRCGLAAGHKGQHKFEMSWRDHPRADIADEITHLLGSKREDPNFRQRLRDRIAQDAELLRRLGENGADS